MAVLRFRSAGFDVARETPNPTNPIFGESLLLWLRETLAPAHALSAPAPEDWGWYATLAWDGRVYLIGASTEAPEPDGLCEWALQVDKRRGAMERLTGRARMDADDPCLAHLHALLAATPGIRDLTREI
jgi:hypothetical protein